MLYAQTKVVIRPRSQNTFVPVKKYTKTRVGQSAKNLSEILKSRKYIL